MAIGTPPPPAKKKSGCGCFGCGCAILVVIAVLLLGGIGATVYFAFQGISSVSSPAAADIPAFTESGGDYQQVQQKLASFQKSIDQNEPAAVHLSATDINSLLAHNPDVARNNVRAYVSLDGSIARLQMSMPSDSIVPGMLKGRYFNIDTSFTVNYDFATKQVLLDPQVLQIGDKQLIGPNTTHSSLSGNYMKSALPAFNQSFNQALRKNSGTAEILDRAQTITVQNGELVIETK